MCGVFGEFGSGRGASSSTQAAIGSSLRHRGPDAEGFASGEGWMLGHRRLAILDRTERGGQPMWSEDRRHVLVFNGEIYNYLELRRDLEAQGDRFRSNSDTEVLLKLLIRDGAAALDRLNGMFAIAFVDLETRRFLLARDRLGVKPFYLHSGGGTLRFASELQALTRWPGMQKRLSLEALQDYLALGYVPGDTCIYEGCSKLPAGHLAEGSLDAPELQPRAWWRLEIAAETSRPEGEVLEELDALLADATAVRMRSDVPVALLLSGGIDSGLVGSYMARDKGAEVLALVAAFDRPEYDETDLARETARRLGLQCQVLRAGSEDLQDVDCVAGAFDEPFADPSALPMLRICRAAREHAVVLLTGDGGDEAFAGYRRYIELPRFQRVMALPDSLKRVAWRLGGKHLPPRHAYRLSKATLPGDTLGAVFDGLGLGRDEALRRMLGPAVPDMPDLVPVARRLWERLPGDLLSRQRAFDYALYLPDDVLVKVDRASMAHSTEARSPFLDYRVAEFAARLPNELLVREGRGKHMLRQLASRRLPAAVAAGGKRGFGVPIGHWIRQPGGAALVWERLIDPAANPQQIWSEIGVEHVLREHLAGRRDYGELLWRMLLLESWLRQNGAAAV